MTKKELIEQVEKSVKTCKKCRLHKNAINAVPGEGNINAELMFIGEAPGQNEDLQGRPFVGRAGKLLELNLEKIGYEYYKLNFILDDFSKNQELENFCKGNEKIIFIDETLDELDFEIDVEVKNKKELVDLIEKIKEKFSVRDLEILTFEKYLKLESIPQM